MSANVDPAAGPPPDMQPPQSSVIQFGKQYSGVPHPQIEELAGHHSEVPIRVQRRNARGQLATIGAGAVTVKTLELSAIEEWGPKRWGGGMFRVEVKDPTFQSRVIFSFEFLVEGMPIATQPLANAPAAVGATPYNPFAPAPGGGPLPLPAPGSVTGAPSRAWVDGLHPHERVAYLQSQAMLGAPVAQFSSDQLAVQQTQALEARLARMEAEAKAAQERHEIENKRLREEAVAAKEVAREAAHQGELKALSAKIDAMSSKPPEKTLTDQMMALAPLVPMGIAWIESRAKSEQAQLQHQTQGFQAMITAAQARPPQTDSTKELITTLAPILGPVLGQLANRGSPDEQAKLFSSMAESQLNTVSMMAQLVEATAPPAESPVGAAIRQGLEGIKNIGMAYIQSQGGLPGQLAGPRPAGVLRGTSGPPISDSGGYRTVEEVGGDVVETPKPTTKPVPAELEALFGMLPADFQSLEWRTILTMLHTDPPAPAERVAHLLATHLEHLVNFDAVPEILSTLFQNPRETLESILEKLPVAMKHPDYARKVLDTTLGMLMEDQYIPRAQPQPAAPNDSEEEEPETKEADEAAAEEE